MNYIKIKLISFIKIIFVYDIMHQNQKYYINNIIIINRIKKYEDFLKNQNLEKYKKLKK